MSDEFGKTSLRRYLEQLRDKKIKVFCTGNWTQGVLKEILSDAIIVDGRKICIVYLPNIDYIQVVD